MSRRQSLTFEFVDYIPDLIDDGILYIAPRYDATIHRCACGCGNEVSAPLSPTDWTLVFDGKTVSLDPSIGNWSFPCRSHYWIRRNRIIWAPRWSDEMIERNREHDRRIKQRTPDESDRTVDEARVPERRPGIFRRLIDRLR